MTDKSSARRVEVAPFDPPTSNEAVSSKRQIKWPYALAFLLIVLMFFALTRLFDLLDSTAEIQLVSGSGLPSAAPEEIAPALNEIADSPFEDALLAEARSDAQEVLAELLPLRRSLEQRRAEDWAARFDELVAMGLKGDELYQSRNFDQALAQYQSALELAQILDSEAVNVAEQLRVEAYAALEQRDANLARQKFELALAIEADNQEAQSGFRRASVLPEVISLTHAADALFQQLRLEEALAKAKQAIELDGEDPVAQQQSKAIEQAIIDRDFQQQMSLGYQALASERFADAESAFRAAGDLKPMSSAVTEALDQVAANRESTRSAILLQEARSAEASEQWDRAQARYQQLLQEDPNRVEARISMIKVEARLKLEQQILQHIEEPLALRDDALWQQAQETLQQARAINNPGPKLREQVSLLAEVVRKARTAVRLNVVSDGQTQVSIVGVSNLGAIKNHPLDLYPGRYVIVGKKSGYQDVRQEVVLSGDQAGVSVEIIPDRSLESL